MELKTKIVEESKMIDAKPALDLYEKLTDEEEEDDAFISVKKLVAKSDED